MLSVGDNVPNTYSNLCLNIHSIYPEVMSRQTVRDW